MNNKIYKKALYLYDNGKINKAIKLCEKEISRNLLNSKVLNLQGLLFYLNGDLQQAIALWNINVAYNDDSISKSYLKGTENDFEKYQLYEGGKNFIENLYISEAIEVLNTCCNSDFNYINVNNALAMCYLRKGNNVKAKEYLDKVLKLDKYNKEALLINKSLKNMYNDKNKISLKIGLMSLAIPIIIITGLFIRKNLGSIELNNNKIIKSSISENINKEEVEKNEEVKENKEVEESEEAKENNTNEIEEVKELSFENVKENYIYATNYYEEGKYEEAINLLENLVGKSNTTHLDDDIIFLLASLYKENGNLENALYNYDKYILDYKDGSYIQEVYYIATLLYKNIDIEKSKEYAHEIIINYPNSIYNNSYVEEIIKL